MLKLLVEWGYLTPGQADEISPRLIAQQLVSAAQRQEMRDKQAQQVVDRWLEDYDVEGGEFVAAQVTISASTIVDYFATVRLPAGLSQYLLEILAGRIEEAADGDLYEDDMWSWNDRAAHMEYE